MSEVEADAFCSHIESKITRVGTGHSLLELTHYHLLERGSVRDRIYLGCNYPAVYLELS